MIGQLNIYGNDKVEQAIQRLQTFEPPEGYHLAFSGGKDSVCIKALADMAGVKYDAHYNITTVDPPELVQFVKTFDDVSMDSAYYKDGTRVTMWNLIASKKMPPTRIARYCCAFLKERSAPGRFVVTGVRQAESVRRKSRGGLELGKNKTEQRKRFDPDNPNQELIHICQMRSQRILNPIIDWTSDDVWEFIRENGLKYCELYDQGWSRIGCIGCPFATKQEREKEFEQYPKIKRAYIRAFDKMLEKMDLSKCTWKNGEDVFRWWLDVNN